MSDDGGTTSAASFGPEDIAAWLASRETDDDHRQLRRVTDAVRAIIANLHGSAGDARSLAPLAEALEELAERAARLPRAELARLSEAAVAAAEGRDHAPTFFDFSPIVGGGNPIAPPLDIDIVGDTVRGRARLGTPYEGPPGHVHGGWIAALFDEVLGLVQTLSGQPGMTGTLTVRYRAPTPLFTDLALTGRLESVAGRKLVTKGALHVGDTLCAEAEGIFITVDFEAMLAEGRLGR